MEIVARSVIMFLFLWAVTRGTGKRELSQMTAFELVVLVTLGDLVQQGVTQEDMSITGAAMAVGTMALLSVGLSVVSFRWRRSRPVLEGSPVIILRDGRPLMEVLRLERVTLDEVKEGARQQGIADLERIAVGVLEPDGKFSFIERPSG